MIFMEASFLTPSLILELRKFREVIATISLMVPIYCIVLYCIVQLAPSILSCSFVCCMLYGGFKSSDRRRF